MYPLDLLIIVIGGGILAYVLHYKGVETEFIVIACTIFGFVQGVVSGVLHSWGM